MPAARETWHEVCKWFYNGFAFSIIHPEREKEMTERSYPIDEFTVKESWRLFRIIAEFVDDVPSCLSS